MTEYIPQPIFQPMAQIANGLACCSFDDPALSPNSGAAMTSGSTYASFMNTYKPVPVVNVYCVVSGAGATLTAGQNLIGIYSADGQRLLATSPDQSGLWTAIGNKIAAVSFTPPIGGCWAVVLSVGTTPPTFRSNTAVAVTVANFGPSVIPTCGIIATGQTALPANFSPAAMTAQNQRLLIGCV
jgi:hypothetical protein